MWLFHQGIWLVGMNISSNEFWGHYFSNHFGCYASVKDGDIGHLNQFPIYAMNQTHSNRIGIIGDNDCSLLQFNQGKIQYDSIQCDERNPGYIVESDALVTRVENILLSVKTADCLPIFIVGGDYIAVIHAGRVGTLSSITRDVCLFFQYMNIQAISVWFGPAICVCCYEVDINTNTYFDLLSSNQEQIESIYSLDQISYFYPNYQYRCTKCRPDLFYSYRFGDSHLRNYFYLSK